MLRAIAIILGIVLAAIGGVIAYRAYFLEPAAAVIISERGVRELPDTYRTIEGIALLLFGAVMAVLPEGDSSKEQPAALSVNERTGKPQLHMKGKPEIK